MPVRVFRINSEEIIAKLKEWAKGFSKDKNVVAVVLFGSLAKGEATPASDADILILLKESNLRFDERIPQFIPTGVGISVEVFPYTLEEFRSLLDNKSPLAEEVSKNGIVLYSVGNIKEFTSFAEEFLQLNKVK